MNKNYRPDKGERIIRYSIRKYSFGVVSAGIASLFMFFGSNSQILADEPAGGAGEPSGVVTSDPATSPATNPAPAGSPAEQPAPSAPAETPASTQPAEKPEQPAASTTPTAPINEGVNAADPQPTTPAATPANSGEQPAPVTAPAGENRDANASKAFEGITLPDNVGLTPRQLDQGVTKEEVENAIKEAIVKANEGKDVSKVTVNIDDKKLKDLNGMFGLNSAYRKSQYWNLANVTVTVNGKKSNVIPTQFLSYALPFWVADGATHNFYEKNSYHNIDKIKVEDPNKYTLTADQQETIKKAFINNNKVTNPDFPIEEKDVTVDNQGNISFKDKFGHTNKIDSKHTVSVFPKFDDIILFSKKENGKWTTNGEYSKTYKLKDGVTYSNFSSLQNPVNQDGKKR